MGERVASAIPLSTSVQRRAAMASTARQWHPPVRSEEHTFELQSPYDLVCRLLLEKKKIRKSLAVSVAMILLFIVSHRHPVRSEADSKTPLVVHLFYFNVLPLLRSELNLLTSVVY